MSHFAAIELALHASAEWLAAVLEAAELERAEAGFVHRYSYCDLSISRYVLFYPNF